MSKRVEILVEWWTQRGRSKPPFDGPELVVRTTPCLADWHDGPMHMRDPGDAYPTKEARAERNAAALKHAVEELHEALDDFDQDDEPEVDADDYGDDDEEGEEQGRAFRRWHSLREIVAADEVALVVRRVKAPPVKKKPATGEEAPRG